MLNYERLQQISAADHDTYVTAQPYPHIVIEDFLHEEHLELILQAFPTPEQNLSWRRLTAELDNEKMQYNKLGMPHERELAPVIRELLWELNSGSFVQFLERLTGIEALISDPRLVGGGLHQILPGGVLGVHADFTRHPVYELDRRINVLLYFNRDWQPDYNGHLELWSRDMTRCERRILPSLGRCVIFNTDADSFHGHPHPLTCPEGMTRKSIALYYYTNGRRDKYVEPTKKTDWQRLPDVPLPAIE